MLTVIWAIRETMKTGTTRQTFRDKLATLNEFPGVQGALTFAKGRKILQIQYLSRIERVDGELKWVNYEDLLNTFDVDAVAGLK